VDSEATILNYSATVESKDFFTNALRCSAVYPRRPTRNTFATHSVVLRLNYSCRTVATASTRVGTSIFTRPRAASFLPSGERQKPALLGIVEDLYALNGGGPR